jgi:hypothetical protein
VNPLGRTGTASAVIVAISLVTAGCSSKHATREPFFTVGEVRTAFAKQGFRFHVIAPASAPKPTGGAKRDHLRTAVTILNPVGGLDASALALQVVLYRRIDDARFAAKGFERTANSQNENDPYRLKVARIGNTLVTYLPHKPGATKVRHVLTNLKLNGAR